MIPFFDSKPAYAQFAGEVDAAIRRVLESGWYILGREVEAFEAAWAEYLGVEHAIGVANGTDALELALRAARIGPGDEVLTVSHTAVATVCAIERAGAKPVFVDIDPASYTLDPAAAEAAISRRTKAIIPVHLYGHPADMTVIMEIASRHGLLVVEDCAQAHGARWQGRLVGTFGHLAAFSFYPTKNLAAYGDAGAVTTRDPQLAQRVRRLRAYGQQARGFALERGLNSRLDELQAAILRVKLARLDEQNALRRRQASRYNELLTKVVCPVERGGASHVYHLYVVRHPRRDVLGERLAARGVETLIHYPLPVHLQEAYRDLGFRQGSLPVTERISAEVLSLPFYFGLDPQSMMAVAEAVAASARELGT